MRPLLAVASLELERRWLLLPLAAAIGFFPLALAPLLELDGSTGQFLGGVFSLTVAGVAALLLGVSVIAGDLAAGRLSFLFARPLPWWGIWGGKMLAAALLTLASGLLALLPTLAFGRGGPSSWATLWDPRSIVLWGGLALLVLGAVHLCSVAVRARTWWLALDLGLLALVAWLVGLLHARMTVMSLHPDGWGTFAWLVWPPTLAVLVAGAIQLASGRTTAGRAHRVASLTLWPLLIVILAGWHVAVQRLAHPALEDLERAWVTSWSARGSQGWIGGHHRHAGFHAHLHVGFLVDAAAGRALRVPRETRVSLASDARRALWIEHEGGGRTATATLVVTRLDDLAARPTRTPLPALRVTSRIQDVVLTASGARGAVLQAHRTSFFEMAGGGLEATLDARDGGRVKHVRFTDERHALAYRAGPDGGFHVERVTLPAGSSEALGRIPPPEGGEPWTVLHFDASGERLLALSASPAAEAQVVDSRSGERIAHFDLPPFASADGVFLADGRLLLVDADTNASRLRLVDLSSGESETLEERGAHRVDVVETDPGRVLVSLWRFPAGPSGVLVLGTDPLRLLRADEGMSRRPGFGLRVHHDRPIGTRVLLQRDEEVVLYDVETGSTTHVTGARAGEAAPEAAS